MISVQSRHGYYANRAEPTRSPCVFRLAPVRDPCINRAEEVRSLSAVCPPKTIRLSLHARAGSAPCLFEFHAVPESLCLQVTGLRFLKMCITFCYNMPVLYPRVYTTSYSARKPHGIEILDAVNYVSQL